VGASTLWGLPTEVLTSSIMTTAALLMPTVRDEIMRICQSIGDPNCCHRLPATAHSRGSPGDTVPPPNGLSAASVFGSSLNRVRFYPGGTFLFRSPETGIGSPPSRVVAKAAARKNYTP